MNQDWIGYQWLAQHYGVRALQTFPTSSQVGRTRSTTTVDGVTIEVYPESYRPNHTFAEHLTFALKYEGVHLEFLSRLFAELPPKDLEDWVHRESSGQYSRRAGFLFEWLTDKQLDFPGVTSGNYVSALPDDSYLSRSEPQNVPRWRVRDNLPGTRHYCPTVRRTPTLLAYESFDGVDQLHSLEAEFGTDILLRSAVWLTIRESRASFQIEHEDTQTDRIKRFAAVMENRLGKDGDPLTDETLATIQKEILGQSALRAGPRKSPVYIGESGLAGEIVHYVAPKWDQLAPMLDGLRTFARTTRGQPSLLRAAVLSFGFVFIHPMADGNGRISRFLVNDTLRRDGAIPAPYILPISATIMRTMANRAAYDRILEQYSKPLMNHFSATYEFGKIIECEDGVRTNFSFSAYPEAQPYWSFPDLTLQCEYLANVILETLRDDMRQEASYLRDLRETRARVKEVLEAPDVELDRIIRSIQENQGRVSGKLRAEFPKLEDDVLASAVSRAVMREAT